MRTPTVVVLVTLVVSCGPSTPTCPEGSCTSPHPAETAVPGGPGSGCRLSKNGLIRREDFPLEPGAKAHFHYLLHGRMNAGGQKVGNALQWDFTFPAGGDSAYDLEAIPVEGQWFASAFPGATWATWESPFESLLSVYEVAGDEVLLRGYVSPNGGDFATELHHDPPVRVMRFPVEIAEPWDDLSTVSGKVYGNNWVQLERFHFQVDREGTVVALRGAVPAFRQRLVRTRTTALATTVFRVDTFFTECLGMVARVTSEKDEPREDFQAASEIWSLAP